MPWITRCSFSDIEVGRHKEPSNCVLIQIVDPDVEFPEPRFKSLFKKIYRYKFLDIEEGEGKWAISDDQASDIANIIELCLVTNTNILVHCTMGVCRSGGVCEAAESIGFQYLHDGFLCPNLTVKRMIMKELYDKFIED